MSSTGWNDIETNMTTPIIVVHGGAALFESERQAPAKQGCEEAARAGLASLAAGRSALDAVVAAVRVLEDCPAVNAGVGSVLTRAETVELDAAVMVGTGLRFGAVAAMPPVHHPIEVARMVLEDGEHVLLCAGGAGVFACEHGVELCDPDELITPRALRHLQDAHAHRADGTGGRGAALDPGTVGACAIDQSGHVATATSTGGTTYKRIGRIGDTPMCGCGTYADDRGGAASATGHGESIIRITMTRRCVDHMRAGASATDAAWRVVAELAGDVAGDGGIICCDRSGRVGAAHNTEHMPHAAAVVHAGAARVVAGLSLAPNTDLMAELLG